MSSTLFGLGQVTSLDARGAGLFAGTAILGVGLALLVRATAPRSRGILVHALANLTTIGALLALG